MHNLLRYYRQNRKQIWIAVLFIAMILIGIQLLNRYTINQSNAEMGKLDSGNSIKDTVSTKYTDPVISSGSMPEAQAKDNKNIIDTFVDYCNNGKTEDAYNILTDECKQMNYPVLQNFIDNYYKRIFTGTKTCDMQSWVNDGNFSTYKVTFMGDMMSTGKVDNGNGINDYITIVKMPDGKLELNINGYIGRKEINKEYKDSKLDIKVINKDIFMNYEVYNFEIKNTSDKTILLDNKKDVNSVYLGDDHDLKYTARMYEVADSLITFEKDFTRSLSIKFDKVYGAQRNIQNINFTKIIMDYEGYLGTDNIENFKDTESVCIKL